MSSPGFTELAGLTQSHPADFTVFVCSSNLLTLEHNFIDLRITTMTKSAVTSPLLEVSDGDRWLMPALSQVCGTEPSACRAPRLLDNQQHRANEQVSFNGEEGG